VPPPGPPTIPLAGGLVLRALGPDDAAAVRDAHEDPDIRRSNLRSLATVEEALAWIDGTHQAWAAMTGATWAVADRDGRVIGRATVHLRIDEGAGEVTYWVVPAARRRGVATAAARAATAWAHEVGLVRVELRHSTRNPASCRVAARAGFAAEGTLRSARRHDDGWHDMHLHAHIARDAEDEGGDPACWAGVVDDHRDQPG